MSPFCSVRAPVWEVKKKRGPKLHGHPVLIFLQPNPSHLSGTGDLCEQLSPPPSVNSSYPSQLVAFRHGATFSRCLHLSNDRRFTARYRERPASSQKHALPTYIDHSPPRSVAATLLCGLSVNKAQKVCSPAMGCG